MFGNYEHIADRRKVPPDYKKKGLDNRWLENETRFDTFSIKDAASKRMDGSSIFVDCCSALPLLLTATISPGRCMTDRSRMAKWESVLRRWYYPSIYYSMTPLSVLALPLQNKLLCDVLLYCIDE